METVKFSCDININVPEKPLDFKILLDGEPIFEANTNQPKYEFSYDIPEDVNEHSIKFVMDGKVDDHTEIDNATKKITRSAQIEIENISLEEIDITDIFLGKDGLITYTHNGNGYIDTITETFDFCMGCNGVVEFKFTMPVYLWLLENM